MNSEKAKILIIDDNETNLQVLGNLLLGANYSVLAANNGQDGINIAQKENPDLILLDIMMPGMDGYEVCTKLKEADSTSKIPIIFVTAKTETEDEYLGFELGAVDYITKPISIPIVLARVKTHVSLHNQKKALEALVKERTIELDRQNKDLEETRLDIVRRLGIAAEYKDNETGNHIIRMSKMSKIIAAQYGFSEKNQELMLNASPMHDIGKIAIPDVVLMKPGKLDEEEWQIMQTHAIRGSELLVGASSELMLMAEEIARTHHEKWDGSGYPNGLKGDEIPLVGRMCAIADVFDALTSKRPYKKAWSFEEAVEEIQDSSGTHFDPELVKIFMKVKDQFKSIITEYRD